MEVAWYLAERDGLVLAEFSDRGNRRGIASAPDRGSALRVIVLEMAEGARSAQGLRRLDGAAAADVAIEEGPTAFHLRWDDRWIDVKKGLRAERRARLLSRAVRAPVNEFAASALAPGGGPLYRVAGAAR